MKNKFDLTGKIAVVTGAGQGLGEAFARSLLSRCEGVSHGAQCAASVNHRKKISDETGMKLTRARSISQMSKA